MMKAALDADLLLAFQTDLKDAYKPFTLIRSTSTFDRLTDQNTTTETTFNSNGIFGSFESKDVDNTNVLFTDVRLLILQSQLDTKPEIGDIINGKRVASIGKDPVDVTWVLGLRSINGLES